MERKLHFDIRDIPACARYGLSARKLWISFKALVLSVLAWDVFVYLGFLVADPAGLTAKWDSARLLPLPSGIYWESWQAVALLCIGILLALASLMSAALRNSRITFEQIRGDDFYSGRDSSRFARAQWKPLAATPAAILIGLGMAVLTGLLLGLIGRIPSAGPFAVALVSVPAWAASLLVVLGMVALLAGLWLVPPIVACTRGDTFETIFELFSCVTSQPWRVFLYWIASLAARALGTLLFLAFSSAALLFFSKAVALGLGGSPASTMASGLQILAPEAAGSYGHIADFFGLAASGPVWAGVSGAVAALSGLAVFLIACAYWMSSGHAGWTLIYLAVRHRRDGEDLLQRADDEDFREFERQYGPADESKKQQGAEGCPPEEQEGGR
jgi:hypothetical protein